jgi:LCP family protein required for cell wall assembly
MNIMNSLKNIKRPSVGQIIFWVIAVALAIGGFYFVRDMVTCWTITPLPGWTPSNCGTVTAGLNGPVLNEAGTPVATAVAVDQTSTPVAVAPESIIPPAWDGASRINILFIGLDYRDWTANEGAPRSDTMILFTIDPLTKTAGMLSIPRDMWVNIPGFGYSRINTAYSSGEGSKLPGGGPALAMKTVEQFLGVPVQYYAQVDFYTFIEFINLIGGIDVYSTEELRLDPLGSGKDKFILTCCGYRHLDGARTLAYARTRKTEGGDIDRAKRQQKVILGIRKQVLDPAHFPVLLGKARQFYEEFSAGIKTNMPFETGVQLAVLARDIPVENIKQGVIDYTMASLDNTTLGGQNASIMKPFPDKIRELRDQIFTSGGPISPLAAQGDPTALMKADAARVRILNGSFTQGLDVTTGNYFLAQGMAVTEVGAADRAYDRTLIILHSPKLYTLKYLQSVFGITSSTQIRIDPDPTATADVEIRLGNDWANNNPMPK